MPELWIEAIQLFWLLIIVHAVCDYPLQGEFLAKFKSPLEKFNGEIVWPTVLSQHALIHAGGVFLITGNYIVSALEFAAHWAIDYIKCRKWIDFNEDQAAHFACKAVWVVIIMCTR